MDIVEADQATERSRAASDVSKGSGREAPPKPPTHTVPRIEKELPSHQDASAPEFRDRSRSPRRPLASPAPPATKPRPAPPRPVIAGGRMGGAASWLGRQPRSEDPMRPFKTAAAGAGIKSTCFQKALQEVAVGPGGGEIFHGSKHGASSSEARPPTPHLAPVPPNPDWKQWLPPIPKAVSSSKHSSQDCHTVN